MVAMGLRHKKSENPELIEAAKGLCGGMRSGLACGALTGAACMMSLLSPQIAAGGGLAELSAWFGDTFGSKYGSENCRDILRDKSMKSMICPKVVEETYKYARQILTDNGYTFTDDED
jgi:hypothetical protein